MSKQIATEHWGLRLEAFRERYSLSFARLSAFTGNRISKSTMQRLCQGNSPKARPDEETIGILTTAITEFLTERGVEPLLIAEEINQLFGLNSILKAAESPEEWGYKVAAFKIRHDLSIKDLMNMLGTQTNERTIGRLCQGKQIRFARALRPAVRDALKTFLESKNCTPSQIEKELRSIFCKEEVEPMITQRAILPKAAQSFFGLSRDPFTGDPRSRSEVFTTPKLDRLVSQLEDAINYQGFVAVIGDVGSGKSLLKKRVVQSCLDSNGQLEILWPQFFNMEKVDSASICSHVLRHFEQSVAVSRVQRAEQLRKFLAGLSEEGVKVALGFDECHRLHPNLLTALKNFWELGSGGYDRYLGLILFGQPRFEMTLRNADFREIAERLDIVRMPNLSKQNDAWNYISHRIKIAGGNAEKLFDRAAIDNLTEIAATPLALGNLANAALLKAHELQEKKVVKGILNAAGLVATSDEPGVRGIRRRA